MLFTVLFYAVGNLQFIVDGMVDDWSEELVNDDEWGTQTYEIAFYAVMELNPKAFEGIPRPGSKGSYIVTNTEAMDLTSREVYINETCSAFSTRHPFLDKMLSAQAGISEEEMKEDERVFFRNHPGEFYPLERSIEIATKHIRKGLLEQSPKTVWKTRLILVFLFLAVQLIPFGTITYCANEDLKKGKAKNYDRQDYY